VNGFPIIECFVALFDILGFKDLVRNSKLGDVFKTYQSVKTYIEEMQSHLEALLRKKPLTIHNFSDTFLIYTCNIRGLIQKDIDEIFLSLLAACDSLFIAANENKLPIRGAITAGELIVADGIEIGKPIIDAYEKEKNQEWIGCWIDQECINKLSKEGIDEHKKEKVIIEYKIPLKDGKVEKKYAYNWVKSRPFQLGNYNFLEDSSDWSAKRKQKNTKEFIDFVLDLQQRSNNNTQ
jgi:hypothetical protein